MKSNKSSEEKGMETQGNIKTITINGIEYVEKSSINALAENLSGMPYVIVRTYSAGVFAGYLKSREGREVEVVNARRLWSWSGAASLSQLAVDGVSNPDGCKFPCEVSSVTLMEAIEILPCTDKAQRSIKGVKVWKK